MPAFELSEYQQRIANTKERMHQQGIDLLFVSQPANMNYLTGYDAWSFYVHQCVLVSLDAKEPVWIGRGMDGNGARLTTFLAEENIHEWPDQYVHSAEHHPVETMVEVIKARGWDRKRIGVEMDQFYFTHRVYRELERGLPHAQFVDADTLVNRVRLVKSEQEIEFMRRAGKIARRVMDAAVESIAVGARECDAAAAIAYAEYSGTEEYGGDYPAIVPLMMAGEATKTPHLTWSDKRYQPDEAVLLELAGVYKRYHCPIARTMFLGSDPPQIMRDTAKVVIEGLQETLAFIRPGVTAEQLEECWRKAIAHSTIVKESRLGYSIGVNYPPDWGEQTVSLRPGDTTELTPNMTLHLIPGIWYDDVGFEIDASVRVTEDGIEHLFEYPLDIIMK